MNQINSALHRIGFIGAGRVGFTFGRFLKENGRSVTGYYSRSFEHAEEAAHFTDTRCYRNMKRLVMDSDVIFLTVSDNAIAEVWRELKILAGDSLKGKILCHTSGAMTSKVFTDSDPEVYGYSIHPNFAVSDKLTSYQTFQNAFITIEGSDRYLDALYDFFTTLGLKSKIISAENKPKYHAAAVYASNYVCGIYGKAVELLTQCGFEEDEAMAALSGLFLNNARGVAERGPVTQLTGPVERADTDTIKKHLAAINEEDKALYLLLAEETLKLARKKNTSRDYSALESLLKKEDTK